MDEEPDRLPHGARRLKRFDYADPDAVYFVTICTLDRRPVFQDAALAQTVVDSLHWLRANRDVRLYAYSLLPDHLHLLLRSPHRLSAIVQALKSFTTRTSRQYGYTGKLWQDRYYDHILRRSEDAAGIARYILENAVRKGLVEESEDYLWSGLPDPMD